MIQSNVEYIKQGQAELHIPTQDLQEYSVIKSLHEIIADLPSHTILRNKVIKNLMTLIQELNLSKKRLQELLLNNKAPASHFISYINFCSQLDIYINRAVDKEKSFALLVINIEGFSAVNNNYSCPARKQLRHLIERKFTEILTINHGIISSINDEEFHIAYEYNNISQVINLSQTILNNLKSQINIDGKVFFSSTRIGIACCPKDGADRATLESSARTASHIAKSSNKNCYVFFREEYSLQSKRTAKIEYVLRNNLYGEHIYFQFQPIVNMENTIVGYETLSRLFSSETGHVSPEEFIPIAEDKGLIHYIDLQAIAAGIHFIKEKCIDNQYVSVNLSTLQINFDQLKDYIVNRLQLEAVDPKHLVLEITESILLNQDKFEDFYKPLKEIGVRFFIDDFGTGYSNLAQFKKFKFDGLKIDKEYVRNLPASPIDQSILKAIVQISKEFNSEVIAEGVENKEQVNILTTLDCNYMQGYYFSKPGWATLNYLHSSQKNFIN